MKKVFYGMGLLLGILSCHRSVSGQSVFGLAPLPYSYTALEPYIDARTMEIHYSKHHQGYVTNLNKALASLGKWPSDIKEILKNISDYPEAVRNNAGGYYNHSLYWNNLSPDTLSHISQALNDAIMQNFSSKEHLEDLLTEASAKRFGSGWVWIIVKADKKLSVVSTPNQDNPLMDISPEKGIPILAIDVWEHAYYLNYQNRRADYTKALLKIINWQEVSKRYDEALTKLRQEKAKRK